MKAQMSLEMIIGLLILVIVAAVVIRTFLTSMGTIDDFAKYKESTELKSFETKCKAFCRDFSTSGNLAYAVQFCTTRLWPEGTKNKFGQPGNVDKIDVTQGTPLILPWPVCEDAIFCFHLYDCSEYTTITIEDCRRILCEYFSSMYSDIGMLNEKVMELIKGKAKSYYGSCDLGRGNWWTRYFFNPDGTGPCEGIIR